MNRIKIWVLWEESTCVRGTVRRSSKPALQHTMLKSKMWGYNEVSVGNLKELYKHLNWAFNLKQFNNKHSCILFISSDKVTRSHSLSISPADRWYHLSSNLRGREDEPLASQINGYNKTYYRKCHKTWLIRVPCPITATKRRKIKTVWQSTSINPRSKYFESWIQDLPILTCKSPPLKVVPGQGLAFDRSACWKPNTHDIGTGNRKNASKHSHKKNGLVFISCSVYRCNIDEHIGSMYVKLYLPTWMTIETNHSCIGKYTIDPMDPSWEVGSSLHQNLPPSCTTLPQVHVAGEAPAPRRAPPEAKASVHVEVFLIRALNSHQKNTTTDTII